MELNKRISISKELLKIRFFEETLDKLFENQKIFGTYHRCIGQEATAISFTHYLDKKKELNSIAQKNDDDNSKKKVANSQKKVTMKFLELAQMLRRLTLRRHTKDQQ